MWRVVSPVIRPNPRSLVLLGVSATLLLTLASCRTGAVSPQAGGANGPVPASTDDPTATPYFFSDVRFQRRALAPAEVGIYVGDRACARCHPTAVRDHSQSRHARTFRPVTVAQDGLAFRRSAPVQDERRGLVYRTSVEGGRCLFQASDGKRDTTVAARYVLGTGKNALTYLSRESRDHFTKLRLTYYTQPRRWEFSPGPETSSTAVGAEEAGTFLDNCLLCHVTVLQRDSDGLNLDRSHLGIGCERCHGPGKPHIQAVERTGHDPGIPRLRSVAPQQITLLCGECHRSSRNTQLDDPHTRTDLARFQGVALEQSACYRMSGTLSCTTCHRGHADADESLEAYDRTCRSCHSGRSPGHRICRVNPRNGCTDCHMPKQSIAEIPYAVYRHHWIRVWPDQRK